MNSCNLLVESKKSSAVHHIQTRKYGHGCILTTKFLIVQCIRI